MPTILDEIKARKPLKKVQTHIGGKTVILSEADKPKVLENQPATPPSEMKAKEIETPKIAVKEEAGAQFIGKQQPPADKPQLKPTSPTELGKTKEAGTSEGYAEIRESYEEIRKICTEIRKAYDDVKRDYESMKRNYNEVKCACGDIRKGYVEIRKDLDELRKGHGELRAFNDEVRKAYDEMRGVSNEMRQICNAMRTIPGEVKRDCDEVKRGHAQLGSQVMELEKKVNSRGTGKEPAKVCRSMDDMELRIINRLGDGLNASIKKLKEENERRFRQISEENEKRFKSISEENLSQIKKMGSRYKKESKKLAEIFNEINDILKSEARPGSPKMLRETRGIAYGQTQNRQLNEPQTSRGFEGNKKYMKDVPEDTKREIFSKYGAAAANRWDS